MCQLQNSFSSSINYLVGQNYLVGSICRMERFPFQFSLSRLRTVLSDDNERLTQCSLCNRENVGVFSAYNREFLEFIFEITTHIQYIMNPGSSIFKIQPKFHYFSTLHYPQVTITTQMISIAPSLPPHSISAHRSQRDPFETQSCAA